VDHCAGSFNSKRRNRRRARGVRKDLNSR
jgi:hypothetical protein